MKTRYLYLVYFIMSVTDIAILNISFITAYYYTNFRLEGNISKLVVANYLWILAAVYFGLYNKKFIHSLMNIYTSTIKSFTLFSLLFFPYIIISKDTRAPADALIVFYFIFLFGLLINRYLYSISENILKRYFKITRSVAVIGANPMALRLAGFFKESNNHFSFEGFLNQEDTSYLDSKGNVLPTIINQIESAAYSGIKEIYLSISPDRLGEYELLQKEAERHCLRLKLVPDVASSLLNNLKVSYMGEFAVLSHRNEPLEEMENRVKKRIFDIVFSSLVIVFVLSWLFPLLGLIIKLQSPGPVLFKQLRSGKDNKPFLCYKFRSMRVNNEDRQATKNDNRITRIGAFLRRTSLDELPQFFNVLKGDMSAIGPRPHILVMTQEYSKIINQYMVRHFLKSGITGWAQVNGLRGETKDPLLMQKRIEHDIWYLENWSMWLDVKIVCKTVANLLKGDENAR